MNRRRITRVILLMLALGVSQPAEAAFVWSPQTGWIGPGGAVKDTPQEQLDYALGFFTRKDYHHARIEFQKLLKRYKDSHEAAEAQYYIGRCREEEGDYYAAFLAYHKTIQVYPSTARFNELLERAYQMGNYFLSGKKRKVFGTAALLPARDKAAEIFQAIVDDGPFSQFGELAQYKLGLAHLALGDYEQAVSAFEQLIDRYPKSPLVDDAKFQLAQASLKGTFKAGYDQHPAQEAIQSLDQFVQEHPAHDLTSQAIERIQVLRERRAEHEFQIAQFYERQKLPGSALIYYQEIVDQFAGTAWAPKAAARLQALEPTAP